MLLGTPSLFFVYDYGETDLFIGIVFGDYLVGQLC